MAILNFSKTYAELSDWLKLPDSANKLVFTEDGHIITRGVDYTQLFGSGKKGLVSPSTGNSKEFLRGNNTWATISTTDLPMASSPLASNNSTTLLTAKQIVDYVNQSFSANDAMRFKGTIDKKSDGSFVTHTTAGVEIAGFPKTCVLGDTYRVISAGKYLGDAYKMCSDGDLLICIKNGSGSALNTTEYWTAVESNINGTIDVVINGTTHKIYSNDVNGFTIYAPSTVGTKGQILSSSGTGSPTWVNSSTIVAGDISDTAKKALFTAISATNGTISATIGGTTKSTTASGTWGISITGSAGSTKASLTSGAGLKLDGGFNGSSAKQIILLPATSTSIGGVIADSGNKTITVDANGTIHLTQQNIINALGYTPGNAANSITVSTVVSNSNTSTDSADSLNPYFNVVQNAGGKKTVVGSLHLTAGEGIAINGTTDTVSIASVLATATILGSIKVYNKTSLTVTATTSNTAGRNYGVQLDSTGKAFVNVPWTTSGLVTATSDGIVPKFDAAAGTISNAEQWVLTKNGTTADWFKLPANAFKDTNTWRDIKINGKSIGSQSLNIKPSDSLYIINDSTEDDVYDLSFGIGWYNISTSTFEPV